MAPLSWEPEFSLGTLSNKNLLYLGYVAEIVHFCESVQSNTPPTKGTLDNALAIMQLYEAYRRVPAGTSVLLPSTSRQRSVVDWNQSNRLATGVPIRSTRRTGGAWSGWSLDGWNSDTMTVGRCYIDPGCANPRHHHPNCDEILVVVHGSVEHSAGDEFSRVGLG